MKTSAKLITVICLTVLSRSAFAQQDGSAFEKIIAGTDAQFAPAFAAGLEGLKALEIQVPAAVPAADRAPEFLDVTEKWTRDGEVVSAFPKVYKLFQSYENARIIKVFTLIDAAGSERRLEVYYTGGDWMQYGVTYIVTNAGKSKDRVSVYPVSELSTPDTEDGETAPAVDPFDGIALSAFITGSFLDEDCGVRASFKSIVTAAAN